MNCAKEMEWSRWVPNWSTYATFAARYHWNLYRRKFEEWKKNCILTTTTATTTTMSTTTSGGRHDPQATFACRRKGDRYWFFTFHFLFFILCWCVRCCFHFSILIPWRLSMCARECNGERVHTNWSRHFNENLILRVLQILKRKGSVVVDDFNDCKNEAMGKIESRSLVFWRMCVRAVCVCCVVWRVHGKCAGWTSVKRYHRENRRREFEEEGGTVNVMHANRAMLCRLTMASGRHAQTSGATNRN